MSKFIQTLKDIVSVIFFGILHIIISAVFCWFACFALKYSLNFQFDWIKATVLFYAIFFIIRRLIVILNLRRD